MPEGKLGLPPQFLNTSKNIVVLWKAILMILVRFFTTNPIPIHLRPEMADIDLIPILCPTGISHKKQLVI